MSAAGDGSTEPLHSQLESLILLRERGSRRGRRPDHIVVGCFFIIGWGFEEDGRAKRGKKHAGGMFFSPGEDPWTCERTRMGVAQGHLIYPITFYFASVMGMARLAVLKHTSIPATI